MTFTVMTMPFRAWKPTADDLTENQADALVAESIAKGVPAYKRVQGGGMRRPSREPRQAKRREALLSDAIAEVMRDDQRRF